MLLIAELFEFARGKFAVPAFRLLEAQNIGRMIAQKARDKIDPGA